MILRQLLSIAILPVTVTVVIPIWLARRHGIRFAIGTTTPEILLQLIGAASLAVGLLLFASSLRQFAVRGKGTLAPWDPPKHLVVEGPYRYVRNPMISGVLFVLIGEALLLRSWSHGQWALLFLVINLSTYRSRRSRSSRRDSAPHTRSTGDTCAGSCPACGPGTRPAGTL